MAQGKAKRKIAYANGSLFIGIYRDNLCVFINSWGLVFETGSKL